MNRIKKGDQVRVISGKNKGSEGRVIEFRPADDLVFIEGVNKVKHHVKASKENEKGGIIEKEAGIRSCKVALLDPSNSKVTTKVKFKVNKSGKKARFAAKSQNEIVYK
jgi:large subunit ribosomal protein L24